MKPYEGDERRGDDPMEECMVRAIHRCAPVLADAFAEALKRAASEKIGAGIINSIFWAVVIGFGGMIIIAGGWIQSLRDWWHHT